MKSKQNRKKFVSLSSDQWTPTEVGQTFTGVVTDKRLVNTARGLRVVVNIVDEETGESIDQFASNLAMQNLARVPIGGVVQLRFDGTERVKIGRQTKDLPIIKAFFESGTRLEENPFAAELAADRAAQERSKGKIKTRKGKRA